MDAAENKARLRLPMHSLCLECGPNISVDEEGCCSSCGAQAFGPWLERIADALREKDAEIERLKDEK